MWHALTELIKIIGKRIEIGKEKSISIYGWAFKAYPLQFTGYPKIIIGEPKKSKIHFHSIKDITVQDVKNLNPADKKIFEEKNWQPILLTVNYIYKTENQGFQIILTDTELARLKKKYRKIFKDI